MSNFLGTAQAKYESLSEEEIYWRDKYNWLLESGYQLRPRYSPEWVPSWKTNPNLFYLSCEDSIPNAHPAVCDAVRVIDNQPVILKRISQSKHPDELNIIEYVMEQPQQADSMNHCLPSLDVLQSADDPDEKILVTPNCRPWDSPEFETVGEVIDCIRQILEGLQFLHEHRIAHRDLKSDNILMDTSLYTERFHPMQPSRSLDSKRHVHPKYTRTQRRPKYYIIDYGLARRYQESEIPPMETTGVFGSDMTVPEFKTLDEPHNPFPIDIYCLGNVIQNDILEEEAERLGFGWILPLTQDMTNQDPQKRPSIGEIIQRFDQAVSLLSTGTLRSQFTGSWGELEWYSKAWRTVPYLVRRLRFTLARTPAIPVDKKH